MYLVGIASDEDKMVICGLKMDYTTSDPTAKTCTCRHAHYDTVLNYSTAIPSFTTIDPKWVITQSDMSAPE